VAGAAGLAVDWEGYGPPLEGVGAVLAGMTAPAGMRVVGEGVAGSGDRGMGSG
jgi:hypothetical protein